MKMCKRVPAILDYVGYFVAAPRNNLHEPTYHYCEARDLEHARRRMATLVKNKVPVDGIYEVCQFGRNMLERHVHKQHDYEDVGSW